MINYSRIAKRPVLAPAVFIVSAAMTFASLVGQSALVTGAFR